MGCGGSCGTGGGCSTGGCTTGGCGKLDVHDWLGDMSRPLSAFDALEVRFKGGRKEFYRNVNNLELYTGDIIAVESQPGYHVGEVTMQGEIVRLQMKKKNITYGDDLPIIYRKATQKDIDKFEQARNRELTTLYRTRELIREQKLAMKLSDIEFQADNSKATFFYSAEERVDFRELIKVLATEFKIRVEMKQISLRQEAGRLGGIGSCGRELCCSNWLTEFKNVNTSAARYQNLSLNPLKLSGQCGRLKCCLNYELDTYINAVKEIPEVKGPLKTKEGLVFLQKTDIFKRLMWFSYANDNNWIEVEVERVHEIMEMNKLGIDVYSLVLNEEEIQEDLEINSDLLALDKKLKKKSGDTSRPKKQKGSLENKNRVNSVTREKSNSKLESKSKSIKNEAKPKVSKAINTQQETKNTVKRENIAPKRENIQSNPHKIEIDSKSNIPNNQEHQKVNIQKRQSVVKNTEVTKGIQEVKKTTEKPKKTTQETPKPLENIAKQEGSAKIWKRQNVQNNNNEEQ